MTVAYSPTGHYHAGQQVTHVGKTWQALHATYGNDPPDGAWMEVSMAADPTGLDRAYAQVVDAVPLALNEWINMPLALLETTDGLSLDPDDNTLVVASEAGIYTVTATLYISSAVAARIRCQAIIDVNASYRWSEVKLMHPGGDDQFGVAPAVTYFCPAGGAMQIECKMDTTADEAQATTVDEIDMYVQRIA